MSHDIKNADKKRMRVLMVHAGNPDVKSQAVSPATHFQMETVEGGMQWFKRQHLLNFELQRQSLIDQGVEVEAVVLTKRKSMRELIRSGLKIRRIARQRSFDIVHALWGSSTSLTMTLFSPIPVVMSLCGSDLLGNYGRRGQKTLDGRFSSLLTQLSAILAVRCIAMSRGLKQALWPIARSKTAVIPAGIDPTTFLPLPPTEARRVLSFNQLEKIVLFFDATKSNVKNRPLAEEVMRIVCRELPAARIEIVEDVPHEELNFYYNAADALLLTSFHEGSNNSLKEAMACNLPIVTTDCGDARERLSDVSPGAVVRSLNPQEIARELLKVLQSSERSNGREHIGDLTLNAVASKIVRVYAEIVQS